MLDRVVGEGEGERGNKGGNTFVPVCLHIRVIHFHHGRLSSAGRDSGVSV